MRIAYLTSQYPAASHTFIRREVEALREQGVAIDTFSIRKPGSGEASADADKAEAGRTFYVLAQSPLAPCISPKRTEVRTMGNHLLRVQTAKPCIR